MEKYGFVCNGRNYRAQPEVDGYSQENILPDPTPGGYKMINGVPVPDPPPEGFEIIDGTLMIKVPTSAMKQFEESFVKIFDEENLF